MIRYNTSAMLQRFTAQWGEPKTPNTNLFLDEFERALKGTDPDVLREATDACIDSERFWPRVADVKRHIDIVAAKRSAAKRYKNPEHQPFAEFARSPEEKARVAELVQSVTRKLKHMEWTP